MRTWQLERTRVGFLFDARALLFASVQEEGEGKLYIKKREIPIRIVDLTRNGANPSPALSSYAGHLQTNRGRDSVKPWTDLTAHCGYFFVPSFPPQGSLPLPKRPLRH